MLKYITLGLLIGYVGYAQVDPSIRRGALGLNMSVISPDGDSLSNRLALLSNNSKLILAPGIYSTPLLGSHEPYPAPLWLIGKTNIVIEGYGAIISNSTLSVSGNMLVLSNCHNITFQGIRFDGGAIVETNDFVPGLLILETANQNITVRDCEFRNNVKGIKNWINSRNLTNLLVQACIFDNLGDTNWQGNNVDGSGVESVGHGIVVTDCKFRKCVRSIEIFNQVSEPVGPTIIANNRFEDIKGDHHILLLMQANNTLHHLQIVNNVFTNTVGVKRSDVASTGIMLSGMSADGSSVLRSAIIEGNTMTGDISIGIFSQAPSLRFCSIRNNHIVTRNDGIRLESTVQGGIAGNDISGNLIELQRYRGISVSGDNNIIEGNKIRNTSQDNGFGLRGAIHIEKASSITSTNNQVMGNFIWDDQSGAVTVETAIFLDSGVARNFVSGNHIWGVTTNIHDLGTDTRKGPRPVSEGTVTLSSGLATVNTIWVTANSRILLTSRATANSVNALTVTNVVDGTSFQIRSASNSDANRVDWIMTEPQ